MTTCPNCERLEHELHAARSELSAQLRAVKKLSAPTIDGVRDVIDLVCAKFELPHKELIAQSRERHIALPRWVAMWLLRKHLKMTLHEIARVFRKDHSTVIHGIRKLEDDGKYLRHHERAILRELDAEVAKKVGTL